MMVVPKTTPGANPPGPHLRDIHMPPDPSWWPPAPGWWGLASLLLVLLSLLGWWWLRRRRRQNVRRLHLLAVEQLARQYQRSGDQAALAAGLHQLLRRVALRHAPQAAHQRGVAWRNTLARVNVDATTLDQLMTIEPAIYRVDAPFDQAAAVAATRTWMARAWTPANWRAPLQEDPDA